MSIILKICLYGTYSKMDQFQKQWIHILKMNTTNFKKKSRHYEGKTSPCKDIRLAHKDQHLQPVEVKDIPELEQDISFFMFSPLARGNKGKMKVHSCSRPKKKPADFQPHCSSSCVLSTPVSSYVSLFTGHGALGLLEYQDKYRSSTSQL